MLVFLNRVVNAVRVAGDTEGDNVEIGGPRVFLRASSKPGIGAKKRQLLVLRENSPTRRSWTGTLAGCGQSQRALEPDWCGGVVKFGKRFKPGEGSHVIHWVALEVPVIIKAGFDDDELFQPAWERAEGRSARVVA